MLRLFCAIHSTPLGVGFSRISCSSYYYLEIWCDFQFYGIGGQLVGYVGWKGKLGVKTSIRIRVLDIWEFYVGEIVQRVGERKITFCEICIDVMARILLWCLCDALRGVWRRLTGLDGVQLGWYRFRWANGHSGELTWMGKCVRIFVIFRYVNRYR